MTRAREATVGSVWLFDLSWLFGEILLIFPCS